MKASSISNKKLDVTDVAKNINNWRDRDAEMVNGIFKNNENPGMPTDFCYKAYPGDPFQDWHFEDGEKYCIPRGIARHLNNECYYKEYKHLDNQSGQFGIRAAINNGRPNTTETMTSMRKVHRYSFQSLEFQDDDLDMIPSKIIEVTKG